MVTTLQSHDQPRVGYEIEKHIFTSQTDPAPFANASTSSLYAYPTVVHVAKQTMYLQGVCNNDAASA